MTRQQELFFNVPTVGEVAPEGVDFDGIYDYLSRSTDFIGNVDSKTFTFSAWVYRGSSFMRVFNIGNGGTTARRFSVFGGEVPQVIAEDLSSNIVLQVSGGILPLNTWSLLLISCDMSDTNKRHFYINDTAVSATWTTYSNVLIDFSQTDSIYVGSDDTTPDSKGRLSNLFLDYTYRDLSIEANRRLFITADGKPTATLKALNPILYLPMEDAATAHINEGTGGNFTLNGTFATSNRGANQDNCVASYFDGVADYLSKTTITGIATTVATISGTFKSHVSGADGAIWFIGGNTTYQFHIRYVETTSSLYIYGKNATNVEVFKVTYPIVKNKEYHFTLSFDITDTNKRHLEINGAIVLPTWATYNTAETLRAFTASYIGASSSPAVLFNGDIGELYYNNIYIDIATSNPFWDAVENKPIPVRKVIANTGVTPLIAMPLDASNAGKNYGTGGGFTVNSGPYVGSRGASEFWARGVLVDNSNYLTYTGELLCASLVKWVSTDSGVTWNVSYLNNVTVTNIGGGTDNGRVAYYFGTSEVINWSLEVNKLRFTDGLGFPIQPIIDSNTLLYLTFNDASNLGENDGSANDLVITGTVTQASDVKG